VALPGTKLGRPRLEIENRDLPGGFRGVWRLLDGVLGYGIRKSPQALLIHALIALQAEAPARWV